jgi:hypothetical protein
MARPKKGTRLVYTGPTHDGKPSLYAPGVVVSYHTNRFHGPAVTVRLEEDEELYADWPIKWTEETS